MRLMTCDTLTLDEYIEEKLKMLGQDFCIRLKKHEIKHFHTFKTEVQVDNYVRDLLRKYL